MAGPVTRRSDRRSTDQLTVDSGNNEELIIFSKLAEAIGDTLEAVCNMQERERSELITVLGLTGKEEIAQDVGQTCDEEQSGTSSDHSNHNVHADISDKAVNNNSREGSDDDLKVIAIKKRKRSLSSDLNSESKRRMTLGSSSKSVKPDFSKYLASKTGITIERLNDSSATSLRDETEHECDTQVIKRDIVTLNRTTVDISEFDLMKDLETKNSDKTSDMEELVNVKEVGRSTDDEISIDDDESMSLLGSNVKPIVESRLDERPSSLNISLRVDIKSKTSKQTPLTDKEIDELLDVSDDEPSNQQLDEQTSLELLSENDPEMDANVGPKLLEVHQMIIPSCVKSIEEANMLQRLFERNICDPKAVLDHDSLPIMTREILDKKRTGAQGQGQERQRLLMTYFAELGKIKSKGLVHGLPRDVAWTKLTTVKRSTRAKGEEKGVDLKFTATPKAERFSSKLNDDGSSDEFEMERDVVGKVAKSKEVSDFDAVINMPKPSRHPTLRQKEEKSENDDWISKPSSSKAHSPPHVNRLKLPRKKILGKLITVTPDKSKSELDKSLSDSAGISLQSSGMAHLATGQNSLHGREVATITDVDVLARDASTNGDNEAHVSDDDVKIVLEVERTENTPIKQNVEVSTSPDTSTDSQTVTSKEEPGGGTCPMCDKVIMSMEELLRHCSNCQGPKEPPTLRNIGMRGRKTY